MNKDRPARASQPATQTRGNRLTLLRAAARGYPYLFLIALLCLLVTGHAQEPVPRAIIGRRVPTGIAGGPVWVVGILTLMVRGEAFAAGPAEGGIELPDIDVYLRRTASRVPVASAKTQLDGKFYLKAPGAGSYMVCWKSAGIGSGCGTKFTVVADSVFLKVVPVRARPGVIYGRVLTADSRPCWLSDSFFNLDVSTQLTLLDAGRKVVQSGVRANTRGGYAFGGVEAGRPYVVCAQCEGASGQTTVSLVSATAQADITLPNHAPRVEGMAAFDSGKGITRAPASATISVSAAIRDVDQDPIEYLWRNLEGSGSIPGTNSAQQNWTVGTNPGLQTLYLMARDGKGGYAFKRFDMQVGAANVGFSGRVIDETSQQPVAKASVDVNGVTTTTNGQGWFRLAVAPAPTPERYVLNISHPQYALLSRIHDKEAVGNTYELIRVQTTTHDPHQIIDVVDTSSGGPCGSPGGRKEGKEAAVPCRSGCPRAETKLCRHRGAQVVVPAGMLVGANQMPAQGPVTMAFATLNPARRPIPGDYRAIDANNAPVEMVSFGALFAEFRDANGNSLDLKSGSTAEIRVPVSNEQLPNAKPSISIWSYDTKRGLWIEEGQAKLENTPAGWMYIGPTTHFSALNMDVAGNDPAQATCVRFERGATLSGWANLVVRAYVSYAGTSVQVKETALDSAQYHAIYRIPYAPPAPPPNTLRLELRGTYGGQQVVLLDKIINTDFPRPKMTGNNLWPPYPYTECGAVVTLEADPVNLPYYGDINATGRPAFLTGPYGQFLPTNAEQVATDYYNAIDPANSHATLGAWWTNHGFNADGSGGTSAQYLNDNDLGFGRDMNCKKSGSDLACYVTNYGLPDQSPANADAAANKDATKRGATVAMEYKASEPADRRVRFYVYAGGDPATAGKLKFADLDGLGPKPVPHLCLVCHGGTFDAVGKNAQQARFREFDLPSFKYSNGRSWDFAPSPNTLDQGELTAFAGLNEMVLNVAPATSPIKDLINAWYPGGFGTGTAPVKPTVPSGWSGQVNGYHNVYGQSCRTCHIARDNGVASSFITFNSSADFSGTSYAVCGSPKLMPNAFVTYRNFWSDLQRVIDYKNLTGATTCQ